jgi:hypothetical protein
MRPVLRRTRSRSRGEEIKDIVSEGFARHISLMQPSMFQAAEPHKPSSSWAWAAIAGVLSAVPLFFSHTSLFAFLPVFFSVFVASWQLTPSLLDTLAALRAMNEGASQRGLLF